MAENFLGVLIQQKHRVKHGKTRVLRVLETKGQKHFCAKNAHLNDFGSGTGFDHGKYLKIETNNSELKNGARSKNEAKEHHLNITSQIDIYIYIYMCVYTYIYIYTRYMHFTRNPNFALCEFFFPQASTSSRTSAGRSSGSLGDSTRFTSADRLDGEEYT